MIHRFVDLIRVERFPDIPILATDLSPIGTHSIWQIGNRAEPIRMSQTAISTVGTGTPHLADPQREPVTGDYVVYSRYSTAGTLNKSVRLVDWDNTTDIQLYADSTAAPAGSLQPTWAPDGSKIMFRARGAIVAFNLIKTMDPDGTNVQTIYTGVGNVSDPVYNFDGTRIAWQEANTIKSANSDGTGAATIFTPAVGSVLGATVAYQHGGNKLVFRHTVSTNEIWKVINDDGTGVATWLTISRSGYGPGQGNPIPIMYTWLENDTEIVTTVRVPADPDPDARLALVSSAGASFVSPARYAGADTGSSDNRPVAITGMAEGVERLYWMETAFTEVSSVLPDGSDYRVDWDGAGINPAGSSFHGFRGDTQNV